MFFAPRPYPSIRLRRASAALALGGVMLAGAVQAAIVPPGVQLAAKQELVRNNGTEVETLDPNVAESVPANWVKSCPHSGGPTVADQMPASSLTILPPWPKSPETETSLALGA